MKQFVILSTDYNPDYLFYTPITAAIWKHFGFEPIIISVYDSDSVHLFEKYADLVHETCRKQGIYNIETYFNSKGLRFSTPTIVQSIRLWGFLSPRINAEDYVVLGDIDMIPLNSFLNRDFDKVNSFGFDLTDRTQIPICYVGMQKKKWMEIVPNISTLQCYPNCLNKMQDFPQSRSVHFEDYWFTDQIMLTKFMQDYGFDKINFVDRGKEPNGFARLRVDRGNWGWQEGVEYMDAHLPRNPLENFELVYDLIKSKINTDIEWINQYTKEFRQLAE
jgi:hypothetical protein